jgi:transglutaminase-like putative cysteine protease
MLCAPDYPLTASLHGLPEGAAGARATVRAMRRLVNDGKVNPELIHRAASLVFLAPEDNPRADIEALFWAVSRGVRYTRDVCGVETLCDPLTTLNRRVGDCDDQATALAALLEAVGYPTRFVIAGYSGGDPTKQNGVGWAPENPTIIEIERV